VNIKKEVLYTQVEEKVPTSVPKGGRSRVYVNAIAMTYYGSHVFLQRQELVLRVDWIGGVSVKIR
jgi:hypothetical protein